MHERIQVLAPMKKGTAGTIALNNAIQAVVNPLVPGEPNLRRGGSHIHVGDRVMQTSNYRYTRDDGEEFMLANGEVGEIVAFDDDSLTMLLDGEQVSLPAEASQGLALAYAVTVHKAQGSEFPIVISAVHGSYFKLLEKRLIYTALSRAKERALVVGTHGALAMAIGNDKGVDRQTLLPSLLAGGIVVASDIGLVQPSDADLLDDVDF